MDPQHALLTDRVAVVTGSAEGIGNAIARCLAAFGANVVVVDIKQAEAQKTAEAIQGMGRRAIVTVCDVRKQSDVDRMMKAALAEFGKVDILVNNVGGTVRKLFMDMTEQEWYDMLDLNLVQAFRCTRAAARVMMDQGIKGSIINLTTIEAYRAAPGYAPYSAAKAGLANFTKTLALELCPWGIRVNSIAPDATETPGILRMRPGGMKGPFPHIPMGRRGAPEDYGGAALYLASDLSEWITGEVIHVGGGTYASSGWKRTDSGHWSTDGRNPQVYSGKPLAQH